MDIEFWLLMIHDGKIIDSYNRNYHTFSSLFLTTFSNGGILMAKVKTFSSQLKIFHVHEELEALDKAVNDFIEQNNIEKIISVSDSATVNADGGTMGLIRVVAYE